MAMELATETNVPVLDMEGVRFQVLLWGRAIKAYDDILTALVDERWKYEMLTRNPALGGDNTTAAKMRDSIIGSTLELATAGEVVCALMGNVPTTLDEARLVYLQLTVTFQRHGNLREINAAAEAEVEGAADAFVKMLQTPARENSGYVEKLYNEALANLEEILLNIKEVFPIPLLKNVA